VIEKLVDLRYAQGKVEQSLTLYAKEKTKENDDKFEIHMEIEWMPKNGPRTTKK
jgi:hypothetical protein